MIKSSRCIGMLAALLLVSGCNDPNASNQEMGRITGGLLGGILGNAAGNNNNRTATTIAGVLIGSYIGADIGRKIDEKNQQKIALILEKGRSGKTISWEDPDEKASQTTVYVFEPQRAIRYHRQICRPYYMKVIVDNTIYIQRGLACRYDYAQWRVVKIYQ